MKPCRRRRWGCPLEWEVRLETSASGNGREAERGRRQRLNWPVSKREVRCADLSGVPPPSSHSSEAGKQAKTSAQHNKDKPPNRPFTFLSKASEAPAQLPCLANLALGRYQRLAQTPAFASVLRGFSVHIPRHQQPHVCPLRADARQASYAAYSVRLTLMAPVLKWHTFVFLTFCVCMLN